MEERTENLRIVQLKLNSLRHRKRKNVEEKRTHFKGFVGFHQVFQHTHFFWNCRRRIEKGEEITFEEIMAENSPN